MAEILFKIVDHVNPDPVKDREGAYKAGMPIAVFEDGHVYGRMESKQQWLAEGFSYAGWHRKTAIIRIPGVSVAKVESIIEPQTDNDSGAQLRDTGEGAGVPDILLADPNAWPLYTFRRRRWQLKIADVPNVVKQAIQQYGEYTTTPAAIRNYIKRIRDDVQFTGLD